MYKSNKNILFRGLIMNIYGCNLWHRFLQSSYHRVRVEYKNAYCILFDLSRKIPINDVLVQNNIQLS